MSSSQSHTTKKRKRAVSPAQNPVSFEVSEYDIPNGAAPGPVIVSTPALDLPRSTPFKTYGKRRKIGDLEPGLVMVAGETATVEFSSSFNQESNNPGCQYLVAIHDHKKHSTKLFVPTVDGLPTPTPVHFLKHAVKSLKSLPTPPPSVLPYLEARNALGETFGTKKAKAQIRQRERQKVDLDAVKGVVSHIVESIDKGAEGLTSKEDAQDLANTNRPIPPFSAEATDPADIYQLHDIIPEVEWKALNTSIAPLIALGNEGRFKDRQAVFPYKHSSWINGHVAKVFAAEDKAGPKGKQGKRTFVMLRTRMDGLEKDAAQEKMPSIPSIVLDSLLSRFTETGRNSTKHILTLTKQTQLHTYMFTLCLRVDDYASDSSAIAKDLSLAVTKLQDLAVVRT
ncbi:hypothetical protein ONZ45_g3773 [Pleurotus djamor]|nr:hypothetical protein ONZ45_g3773 [Pleurotus djamor]